MKNRSVDGKGRLWMEEERFVEGASEFIVIEWLMENWGMDNRGPGKRESFEVSQLEGRMGAFVQ